MILDVIAAELPQMSAAKRAVGEFVLTNWRYTAFLNAAQLAAQAGVSESVVVRFTKELGLTGFPDFQERIQDLVMREMGILDLYKDSSLSQPARIDERSGFRDLHGLLRRTDFEHGIGCCFAAQCKRDFLEVDSREACLLKLDLVTARLEIAGDVNARIVSLNCGGTTGFGV